MWGKSSISEAAEASHRQSALTRDLQALPASAPRHIGPLSEDAAARHTPGDEAQRGAVQHVVEPQARSGAVSIRRPEQHASQAHSLQLGANVLHLGSNSLHLGACHALCR